MLVCFAAFTSLCLSLWFWFINELFCFIVQPVRERHLLLKEFEWVRMMIMFLVVILPPRGLDPSSLRVTLNLLSSSFPLSLFCCVQKIFWQL